MAVCNIFNKLSKNTGNFLTFSQYSEDLTKGATQYEAYRVVPSKFIVMDVDYNKISQTLNSFYSDDEGKSLLTGDLNQDLPRYFRDYYENGCAYLRSNYNGDWNPKLSANMFWNTLYKANMLTTTENENLNYFINEVRYIGDINIQSYDEKSGEGYSEIYCYIPSEAKAYKYGTIDLKPEECECAPYTAKEVDDRIQYIDPYTILNEPYNNGEVIRDADLEKYIDDPQMWSGPTKCACGCESYETQEIKDALEECNCYPYSEDEINNRIYSINPFTEAEAEIPSDNNNYWTGASECNYKDESAVSYENPEVGDRISNINPITMTEFGNMSDGEDGNIEDYQTDPNMWSNDENGEHHAHYQTNEIKNRIYELEGKDIVLPVNPDEEIVEDGVVDDSVYDGCCAPLTEEEMENRINNINPLTAVSVADDWTHLANYSENKNIWDDPEALAQLFEEMNYDVVSELTNTSIRNYFNENEYLEGFEGNEEYSIENLSDLLKIYYADNSLLDKAWINSRGLVDDTYGEYYKFNTVIVLYDIHKIDKNGNWTLYSDYENLPLGIYFTGKFNEDNTLTNPVTKYIDSDEIYKEGTAYGLRLCYRFAVSPMNVSIKSVNITQENDNYSAFCQVMTEMSKTQQMMNNIITSMLDQTQQIKDALSIFKNNRVNVPYIREVNDVKYWFANGKLLGPATVQQFTPVYVENTTVFPNTPTLEDLEPEVELDNPIKFTPVNTTNLQLKNNGKVGTNASEDLIIEVDYGDAELVNDPFILTDWITEIKEL